MATALRSIDEAPAAPPPIAVEPTSDSSAAVVIASLLCMAALWVAQSLLVPIVIATLISYALDPLQRRAVGWGVPRGLAAALVLTAVFGGVGLGVYAMRNQASAFVAKIPVVSEHIRDAIDRYRQSGETPVSRVQQAAADIQKAATEVTRSPADPGVTRVQIESPGVAVPELVWRGWRAAADFSGQALLVFFLAYYLLAAGDLYKRKVVKLAGPSLSKKKVTVEILNDIDRQIESFLVTRVIVSLIVGTATGIAFWALGVGQAAVWGVAAGVLNVIPYLGPGAVTAASAIAGYVQFGSWSMALAVSGAATVIASLEGFLLTPWLMGRAGRMSAVAIFVGVAFWGWIWGISGLLLAVPIMMVAKAICDHVESLQPVGELLGD